MGDSTGVGQSAMSDQHTHRWVGFHADYCHYSQNGEVCEDCGAQYRVEIRVRDFSSPDSAWWHWGRVGCKQCADLMKIAGLDPRALADEKLACREIERQFRGLPDGR